MEAIHNSRLRGFFFYFFLDEKVNKKSMRFANLDFSLGVLNT